MINSTVATLPFALATVVFAGCATATRPTPASQPSPAPSVAQVPSPTPPTLIPNARMVNADTNAVPALSTEPAIVWGPEPAGTLHTPQIHNFDLLNQRLNVRFDWARHAVVGNTTLSFAALDQPVTTIRLNAVGMTIHGVSIPDGPAVKFEYDGDTLFVHLPRPLRPRGRTAIMIDYETVRPKKGAYFIDRNHYLWTQGETEDTRYWIPTYDHPDDKTTWQISVTTDPDEKALSNGRLVSSRRVRDGIVWNWVLEHPASTYLMSVVTGKYAVVTDHWKNIPVEYWTYPDSIAAAKLGFGRTPEAIDVFSRRTGVPFAWTKYAQSVVPDFIFGGMENVTATTQNDNGILHPAWAEPQANADGLMSHELGHQWYGDLLTTRDWSHAWLNEGFATFMEQTFREAEKGIDEAAWDRMDAQQQTIEADRRNRRPIVYNRWIHEPLELFFSGHIYPKGATVLQMLRHQLGDSLFWHAMHVYTASHMYQNVTTDDLRRSFEQATGRNFKPFFDQWVYGAGFPVFQVTSSYDSAANRLTLHAVEVQPRDSLTGYFDTDVDVDVLTEGVPVRATMSVRNGSGDLMMMLPAGARPRAIEWNRGHWILALSDFPRSTAMLDYQLSHSDDVTSRAEAVELLRTRTDQPAAAHAIATAATSDAFWAMRQLAVESLTAFAADSAARRAISAALSDKDARVRQSVAVALAKFPGPDVAALLANSAQHDTSPIVRGAAVASYLAVTGDAGLALAESVMAPQSWQNVLRAPALKVLKSMSSPQAQQLYTRYAPK